MDEFPGTDRFQLRGRLGEGGMGVVYRVFDREQGLEVALKCLRECDPLALTLFKREFRRLCGVSHRNLVSLMELVEDRGRWFYTMELIEGTDLFEYLRPGQRPAPRSDSMTLPDSRSDPTARLGAAGQEGDTPGAGGRPLRAARAPAHLDWDQLRTTFRQLAEGAHALHRVGLVHRDIKPSNVRVEYSGRAVLLDFGIAELIHGSELAARSSSIRGTPLYMAPEEYSGTTGPPSDWYSFGMMLYYVILGAPPITGSDRYLLEYKLNVDFDPPSQWVSDVPEDLSSLCCRLLNRNRDQRPNGEEILARLDRRSAAHALGHPPQGSPLSGAGGFVGRDRETEAIVDAFAQVRSGRARSLLIEGESGLGKTALVQNAVARILAEHPATVVLRGRCHERETVPFKAFDGVVDDLTEQLLVLPTAELDALLPQSPGLLTHLFPVLARLAPFARRDDRREGEGYELRRRAFTALRELLGRLARVRSTILVLDDLHWADVDSLSLLRELVREPDAPPLLLLANARAPREGHWQPHGQSAQELFGADLDLLKLTPLTDGETVSLAAALVGDLDLQQGETHRLAAEARGHPLYLQTLLRHVREQGSVSASFHLDEALWARAHAFGPDARLLMHLVALAGEPLANETFRSASELQSEDFARAVSSLDKGQLIRQHGMRLKDALEPYHDRVREVVVDRIAAEEKPRLHRRLAEALERTEGADPQTLAVHWEGANQRERAAAYAERAAHEADAAFAFDGAVRLHRRCLALEDPPPGERRRLLLVRLAEALTNAGRSAEAAETYLLASVGAAPEEELEWKRLAAEKFMQSGHLNRGMPQLEAALQAAGLKLRSSRWKTLPPLLMLRIRLALRGLDYQERPVESIAREQLKRMDIAFTATTALAYLDPIAGAEYASQFLLWALESGEPSRIAHALALEYSFLSALATRETERGRRLIESAESLARRIQDSRALAYTFIHRATVSYSRDGDLERTLAASKEAERLLRQCRGVSWELAIANMLISGSYWYMGRWAEMKVRVHQERADAIDRGDYWSAANACGAGMNCVYLMDDNPTEARLRLDEGIRTFDTPRFYLAHVLDVGARSNILTYEGDGKGAHEIMEGAWKLIESSYVLKSPLLSIIAHEARARAALAAIEGAGPSEKRRLLKLVARCARRIGRGPIPWGQATTQMLQAAVARNQGRLEDALELLARAEKGFSASGVLLYTRFVRCARGKLQGDDIGKRLLAEACETLAHEGIRRPERLAAVFAPGFGLEG